MTPRPLHGGVRRADNVIVLLPGRPVLRRLSWLAQPLGWWLCFRGPLLSRPVLFVAGVLLGAVLL